MSDRMHYCEAPTPSGYGCGRLVKREGDRCWQHDTAKRAKQDAVQRLIEAAAAWKSAIDANADQIEYDTAHVKLLDAIDAYRQQKGNP